MGDLGSQANEIVDAALGPSEGLEENGDEREDVHDFAPLLVWKDV